MTIPLRVGIIGAGGYSGTELLRILNRHPRVEITYLAGSHEEDTPWSKMRPYLPQQANLRIERFDAQECANRCDFVFVALPSGAAGQVIAKLWPWDHLRMIDLSGDLRLSGVDYQQWYGKEPCPQAILQEAVYGLTEWNRNQVRTARIVSNPGCYATATLLALRPLAKLEAALDKGLPIIVDAKSGVSGAGKKPAENLLLGELQENFYAYKVGRHQHTPEIERYSGLKRQVLMTTQLLPAVRGIFASLYIHMAEDLTDDEVYEAYQRAYAKEPFVMVQSVGEVPQLKHVRGSNRCHLGLRVDQRTHMLQIFSVIDNLQKGAAGQAVQNLNVMLEFGEAEALDAVPVYP